MTKSARGFLWDNLLSMGAYWLGTGTVTASLCAYYGISLSLSNVLVGLSATLPVVQLLGSAWYARTAAPRRFILSTNLLWRCFLPLAFFTVLLPQDMGKVLFVLLYFLEIFFYQVATPVQNSWMAISVSGAPSNYYALRETFFMLTYTVGYCAVNLFLASGQKSGEMRGAFLNTGLLVAVLLGASLLALLRLPAKMPAVPAHEGGMKWRAVWQNKSFRSVLLLNMAFSFFSMLVGGYAATYQVQVLKVNFVTLMVWGVAASLLRTLFTPVAGKAAEHGGWNRVICVCMLSYTIAACVWLFMSDGNRLWSYPVAVVLGALTFSGTSVGFLQLQVNTTPNEDRSTYFAMAAACTGVAALAGTGLCSALIDLVQAMGGDLRLLFLPGAVGMLLCALAALRLKAGRRGAEATHNA